MNKRIWVTVAVCTSLSLLLLGFGLGRRYQHSLDTASILAAQQDADQAAGLEDYCKSLLQEQEDQ